MSYMNNNIHSTKPPLITTKLSDFKVIFGSDPSYLKMLGSIEELYQYFSSIEKPEFLTCLDPLYEDNEQIESIILSYDIRIIPNNLLKELEFYGNGWGNLDEVKYFLPRLLECIAIEILNNYKDNINNNYYTGNGLLKYKLDKLENWPQEQRNIIFTFFYDMFRFLANHFDQLTNIIDDFYIDIPLQGEEVIKIWDQVDYQKKKKQFYDFLTVTFNSQNTRFEKRFLGKVDLTNWIISDKHAAEFDFVDDEKYWKAMIKRIH